MLTNISAFSLQKKHQYIQQKIKCRLIAIPGSGDCITLKVLAKKKVYKTDLWEKYVKLFEYKLQTTSLFELI